MLPTSVIIAMVKSTKEFRWDRSSKSVNGWSALDFLNHCHLNCDAQAMTSKLGIPSPPWSNGLVTFMQTTRQHPPLAWACPFQISPFLNLCIALMNHLGTFRAISRYTGMTERRKRTMVAHPTLFKSRDENGTDIFRPYSRPNSFRGVQICPYPSPNIQHPIPYPYSNT